MPLDFNLEQRKSELFSKYQDNCNKNFKEISESDTCSKLSSNKIDITETSISSDE